MSAQPKDGLTPEEALPLYRKRLPRLYRWSAPKIVTTPHGYPDSMVAFAATVDGMLSYFLTGRGFGRYCGCWAINKYGNQTYYVPKELGQDAIATRLPGTKIKDWRMPFPGLRFVAEEGTFVHADGRQLRSVDLAIVPKGTVPELPSDVHADLIRAGYNLNQNGLATDIDECVCYSVVRISDANGREEPAALILVRPAPADAPLSQVLSMAAVAALPGDATAADPAHSALQTAGLALALNCARLMTRAPEHVEGGDELPLPAGQKRIEPGAPSHRPRFVGLKYVAKSRREPGPATGRKLPEGWRAGHDKWVRFGPGLLQRRLVHVEPYKISDRAELPKQHVGTVGERADFAVTLVHSAPLEHEGGWHLCIFEDDDGNALSLKTRSLPADEGDPIFLRATVERHYIEAEKPRTEIRDAVRVFEQEIVPSDAPPPSANSQVKDPR